MIETIIDGRIGIRMSIIVMKGETFQYRFPITDKVGTAIPLPPDLSIKVNRGGAEQFVFNSDSGLTIDTNALVFESPINLAIGRWNFREVVQADGFPSFLLYGEMDVN
jgi:hypothetical protein